MSKYLEILIFQPYDWDYIDLGKLVGERRVSSRDGLYVCNCWCKMAGRRMSTSEQCQAGFHRQGCQLRSYFLEAESVRIWSIFIYSNIYNLPPFSPLAPPPFLLDFIPPPPPNSHQFKWNVYIFFSELEAKIIRHVYVYALLLFLAKCSFSLKD